MEKFTKITEKLLGDNKNINQLLVKRIRDEIRDSVKEYESNLFYSLEKCESPIEQLLALEMEKFDLRNSFRFNPYIDIVEIERQEEIKCGSNKYRVDFLIPVWYANQGGIMFVIECDGYEFHQKTKEQVENDNKRHRNLQKYGYEVIRFSGSEIWTSPSKCVFDILNIIRSKCEYKDK